MSSTSVSDRIPVTDLLPETDWVPLAGRGSLPTGPVDGPRDAPDGPGEEAGLEYDSDDDAERAEARRQRMPALRSAALRAAVIVGVLMAVGLAVWLMAISAAQRATISQGPAAEVLVEAPEPVESAPSSARDPGEASTDAAATSTQPRVDPHWTERVSTRTGIPNRAVIAYANAQLRLAAEKPSCGVSWNTLAAIGTVESANATHNGTVLLASGRTDRPIRGPVLDGNGVGAVRDTDNGRWDGDATWDRALGPMQFIPSTWRKWAADGNGDGVADPDQIDDAALAAARYLCASGRMGTSQGWLDAVYAYNHSSSYVQKVADTANLYAAQTS